MPAPIITFRDQNDNLLSKYNFGTVQLATTSSPITAHIWNNYQGTSSVSDAINTTITTLTFNGLVTGDTVANGQEVVTYQMLNIQNYTLTPSPTSFTPVGGNTAAAIGSTQAGTIPGSSPGSYAGLNLEISVPSNATPGAVQFLTKISYNYV